MKWGNRSASPSKEIQVKMNEAYIGYQWICNKPQHPTIILSERENPIQKNMDAQLKHATKSDLINKELKKYMPEQETKTDLQAKKQLAIRYLLSKS